MTPLRRKADHPSDEIRAEARSYQPTMRLLRQQEEKVMYTTSEISVRELDHRTSDGIDVWLLWNSDTGRVSVAVEDGRFGESFELDVDAADALNAFRHPYVYTDHDHSDRALAA
jgi:hypothetical protein